MMKKKKKITLKNILILSLAAAIVLLGISIYAYAHSNDIQESIRNRKLQEAAEKASASDAPVSQPLSSELTSTSSMTILVDKTHTLAADYVPDDLSTPYLNSTSDVIQLRQEAGDKAKEMKQAAADAGITLIVSSGYRSYSQQGELYANRVSLIGEAEASRVIAKAGASEHQTGLALDFTNDDSTAVPTMDFADSDTSKWLYEHAHEFGWILRYPEGKEDITGYSYMPWHYRYVGVDTANAMYAISPDETFEEYFNINSVSEASPKSENN